MFFSSTYERAKVKNVYYIGSNQAIIERAAKSNDSNSWYSENLSGLYKAASGSSLSSYWTQNFTNVSQALLVMFQDYERPDMFSIGKYTSWKNISNEWISIKYNFTTMRGSPLAMTPLSSSELPHNLLLYAAKPNGQLAQYLYNVSDDSAREFGSTNSTSIAWLEECACQLTWQLAVITDPVLSPRTALVVIAQNNTSLYPTWGDRPECSRNAPLTHLILYTNTDRSGLNLDSWNCSSGLINQTNNIASLVGRNRKYLGLASHQDGKVYVQYDQGFGPEIEEWAVPQNSLANWVMSGKVNVKTESSKSQ
jgi:hypothetical protein